MKMKRTLNLDFTLIEVFFCIIYAVVVSFASPILLSKGYSNSTIGIILAAGSLSTVIAQPLLADYMDTHPKVSTFKVSIGASAVMAILLGIIMLIARVSLFISLAFIAIITVFWAISPLLTALCFKLSDTGYHVNYGSARAFGSLAYALSCSFCGYLSENYGSSSLIITGILALAVFAFIMYLTCIHYNKAKNSAIVLVDTKKEETIVSFKEFINHNVIFLFAMIGVMLFSYGSSVFGNFAKQIIDGIGGNDADMGNILSFSALLELPVLFAFDAIHKRFRCVTLLKIAAIFYVLKLLAMYLARNVFAFYLAQLFQIFQYPLFLAAIIAYVNEIMPKNEATRGQAIYNITTNISSIISSFTAGFIIDSYGSHITLLVSLILSIIGVIIFIPCINKVENDH